VLGFLPDERLQRGRGEYPPGQPQAADDGAPIAFLGEVARVDRRGVARAVRFGLDIAARQGPHLPGAGAEAGSFLEFADLAALEAAWRERDLHIGCRRLFQHLDRSSDNRGAVGQHALAGEQPAQHLTGQWEPARALIDGLGSARL
jgi:hypothetical protein